MAAAIFVNGPTGIKWKTVAEAKAVMIDAGIAVRPA